ncbi:MAG: 3D domain-containing protein [bacterium]
MKTYNKSKISTKSIIFLLGILFIFVPFLDFYADQLKASKTIYKKNLFEQERLTILGNDSLLPIADPSAPEPKVVKKMNVVVTAYSSTVWQTDDTPFITAANTYVREGIVANNYLPFGTKVRMPEIYGDKIFIVEDRMSSKKSNYHIDIWLSSYFEAKEFGAKKTYIEVLES